MSKLMQNILIGNNIVIVNGNGVSNAKMTAIADAVTTKLQQSVSSKATAKAPTKGMRLNHKAFQEFIDRYNQENGCQGWPELVALARNLDDLLASGELDFEGAKQAYHTHKTAIEWLLFTVKLGKQGMDEAYLIPGMFVPSSNDKIGHDAINHYHTLSSCPDSCLLKQTGTCYARSGHTRQQAIRPDDVNDSRRYTTYKDAWRKLVTLMLEKSRGLPLDTKKPLVVRTTSGGDWALAGTNELDAKATIALADVIQSASKAFNAIYPNRKVIVYAYTHTLATVEADKVKRLLHTKYGFTLNTSTETVEAAYASVRAGVPAVQITADVDADIAKYKALGVKAVLCPNQTKGTVCTECQRCTKFNRKTVVLFKPHGNRAKVLEAAIRNLTIPSLTI